MGRSVNSGKGSFPAIGEGGDEEKKKRSVAWGNEDEVEKNENSEEGIATLRRSSSAKEDVVFSIPPENIDSTFRKHSRFSVSKEPPKVNCFMAIFATRQLASKGNRELYIKYSVRELFIYTIYLAAFCTMVFLNNSSLNYYYTKVMRDLFVDKAVTRESDVDADNTKTFETSTDVRDFWNYVEGPMLEGLYWENWYGAAGADKTNTKNLFVRELVNDDEKYGILYENRLIGLPRLRQLRVVITNCSVADNFRQLDRECYPEYNNDFEDTGDKDNAHRWKDFPQLSNKEIENAWTYRSEILCWHCWHWGHLSWYTGNGAVLNLERAYSTSKQRMKQLKQNLWITRATRAVFLDFTVYNANINLFCIVKLVWEFPATGGVMTSFTLRTVKLIGYITKLEIYVVLPCEILFIIFTLYYLIQEIVEMAHLGCRNYLFDLWSWLDITILITSLFGIAFRIFRYYLVKQTLKNLTENVDRFNNFEFLAYWETQFNHAVSLCLFFSWVKVFKYISFNKTMTQLSSTLSRCAKDIGGFAIMFFIVFFAFAQLGNLLFGSQIEDFSTFINATFTLLRLILGDFNFRQIEAANRALGPIFFLAYVFFVFFVLLNMFLAIINDTYSEVKAEIQAQRNEFEIVDYFKRWGNNIKGKIGKRNERLDAETSMKLAAADGQITYDELRENLQLSSFNGTEIEMFLARFDLGQDRALNEEETQQVLHDLEGVKVDTDRNRNERALYHNNIANLQSPHSNVNASGDAPVQEDFDSMEQRVQVIETSLMEFIHKTSEILQHVQARVNQNQSKTSELKEIN